MSQIHLNIGNASSAIVKIQNITQTLTARAHAYFVAHDNGIESAFYRLKLAPINVHTETNIL